MTFTIAIAGRPNVGKSTLFNRLIGKQMALVDDTPGVTRDWREGDAKLYDLSFRLIDTAGLEDRRIKGSIAARTAVQTKEALSHTNIVLFIVDARAGLTEDDKAIAREIRKLDKPIILVGNKCEGIYLPERIGEFDKLGFGDPVAISATHGDGLMELHAAILENTPVAKREGIKKEIEADDTEEKHLLVTIAGRPNVGKSTLINHLIGEERMLVGPEPGLTRDAIPISWTYRGRPVRLIDTAGLRRKAKVTEKLEKMSGHESLRAIRLANVVILVVDGAQPLDKQELVIAHHVADEGRCLVVAVNKWDAVEDKRATERLVQEKIEDSLAQLAGVPVVMISALKGHNLDALMKAVMGIYEIWNKRVSTNKLNRWLEEMEEEHPPPITQGRRIKLRYITQIKARPPTFQMWVNKPVDLPASYQNFLTRGLREKFGFNGVPLRWQLKKGDNPYKDIKKSIKKG